VPVNCFNQLITHARSQDLGFRTSIFGSQDLDLKTWVSGPQREVSGPRREVSGPGSQDLGFRPSVFGSQDLGFRTSKALHPTVVLSFSRHFSLRPMVTDKRTDGSAIENAGRFCQWIKMQRPYLAAFRSHCPSGFTGRIPFFESDCPDRFCQSDRFCQRIKTWNCPTVWAGSAVGLKRETVASDGRTHTRTKWIYI